MIDGIEGEDQGRAAVRTILSTGRRRRPSSSSSRVRGGRGRDVDKWTTRALSREVDPTIFKHFFFLCWERARRLLANSLIRRRMGGKGCVPLAQGLEGGATFIMIGSLRSVPWLTENRRRVSPCLGFLKRCSWMADSIAAGDSPALCPQ